MDLQDFLDERKPIDGPALEYEISRLLPPNMTPLEYDALAVAKRTDRIPFPLADLVDPAKTPMPVLPFLAWGASIDLWDDTWSDDKKRAITLKSHYLHSLKGTAAGITEHVRFTGASVHRIVAPPVAAFATKTYTQAERDAFLAVMPQFRIYRFLDKGVGTGKQFLHGKTLNQRGRMFLGRENRTGWTYRACMPLTDAANRIGSRAFLWDHDAPLVPVKTLVVSKTSVTSASVDTYQLSRKGDAGYGIFPGPGRVLKSATKKSIIGGTKQSGGLYTISVDGTFNYTASSLHLNTVTPGLTPVDTRFIYVAEKGTTTSASCFPKPRPHRSNNMCLHRRFLPETTSARRLYQQLYLFDPTRGVPQRQSRSFLGNLRLGIPAFTAEIQILTTGKRLRNSANDFVRGYLHKTDHTELNAALRAVRISKAARDKTLVKIGLRQVPYLSAGLPLDTTYHFGDRLLNGV